VSAPDLVTSLYVIYARNDRARRVIIWARSAMPNASQLWAEADRALADVPALGAVITRLSAELAEIRLDRANLLAAMRATLAAHADGEPDPLYYLRDELDAAQARPEGHGGNHVELPADAPAGPAGAARRHAAHDGHQPR